MKAGGVSVCVAWWRCWWNPLEGEIREAGSRCRFHWLGAPRRSALAGGQRARKPHFGRPPSDRPALATTGIPAAQTRAG